MKKQKTEENLKEKKKKEKLPKEISQDILKKVFFNLLRAIGVMAYFAILNIAYSTMKQDRLMGDIEVFAGAFLIAGIYMMEKAYKNDSGTDGITAVELIFLSLHSLSIKHIITMFKYEFQYYLLVSSYIIAIYYVFKATVLYTKGRKEYLDSLSDIPEILKKDEPVKKEARKRTEEEKRKAIEVEKENKVVKKKSVRIGKKKTTNNKEEKNKKKKTQEKATEEKPKKKRGRPKKEVKEND